MPSLPLTPVSAGSLQASGLTAAQGTLSPFETLSGFDVINVRNYGATGDGVTDDTDAIQGAIDDVPSGGGMVFFPVGTYLITSGLSTSQANLELRGVGGVGQYAAVGVGASVISCSGAIVGFTFNSSAASTIFRGPVLRDLVFKGTSSGAGGVLIKRSNNWIIENVSVTGFTAGYGIYSDGTGNVNQYGTMNNPNCTNCLIGIDLKASNGIRVIGGMIDANSNSGAVASGTTGVRIQSGDSTRIYGLVMQYMAKGIDQQGTSTTENHSFTDCRFEGFTTAITINGYANSVVGCGFNNYIIGGGGTGISIASTSRNNLILNPAMNSVSTRISDSGFNNMILDAQGGSYPLLAIGDGGSFKWSPSGVIITEGSGSPEGAITAPVGSLFLRTDGSTSTTLYVKTSGTGNTGWTAK